MKNIAIAFAGGIKSGKSSLSTVLATRLGLSRVSFGDHVRKVVRESGNDPTDRAVLQQVGEFLVRDDITKFCLDVLSQAGTLWHPGEGIVIDGLRHVEVAKKMEELVNPSEFRIMYIEVDKRVREGRLESESRGAVLDRWEKHSTETQVRDDLIRISDLVIDGNLEIQLALDAIVNWLVAVR